ncbi:MAG: polysaccharide pyruvyl transferase family protein [Hominilimicola sp.]
MRIFLDGYADNNFGDDLMLTLAANGLNEHELYTASDKFHIENIEHTRAKSGFDIYLKVTGSGFLIHNNAGILYRMLDMRREKKYAPQRAVINCNISGFINKTAEKLIQRHIKGYDFITVRDEFSYDYIRRNLPDVPCETYPDMAFSIPDSMIPDTPCENALGIAVHNSADCAALSSVADRYIEETGKKVMLLCFDTGLENDAQAAEKVYGGAKYKSMIYTTRYAGISDMLANMKKCGVILGIRLHSNVLAARMNIPFVPMAYSDKTINTLNEIGYNGAVYPSDSFDAEAVLQNIFNAKPYILDKEIIIEAKKHIIEFNKYLKRQG